VQDERQAVRRAVHQEVDIPAVGARDAASFGIHEVLSRAGRA